MENIEEERRIKQMEYKRNWDLKLKTVCDDPIEEAKRLDRLERNRKSKRDYSKNGPKYMQEYDKNLALEFIRQKNNERARRNYYRKKNALMTAVA